MNDLILFLALVFATYRMSYMVALEEGFFEVFTLIRKPFEKQKTWIGRGLHCVFCLSFWFGWLFALPYLSYGLLYVAYALALSGVTVLIHKYTRNL